MAERSPALLTPFDHRIYGSTDRSTVCIAIVGAGPAGLTLALALAVRRSLHVDVFERAADHRSSATFNPDRSYTIDITGHGLKAARYVGLTRKLDDSLIPFLGIRARLTGGTVQGARVDGIARRHLPSAAVSITGENHGKRSRNRTL